MATTPCTNCHEPIDASPGFPVLCEGCSWDYLASAALNGTNQPGSCSERVVLSVAHADRHESSAHPIGGE